MFLVSIIFVISIRNTLCLLQPLQNPSLGNRCSFLTPNIKSPNNDIEYLQICLQRSLSGIKSILKDEPNCDLVEVEFLPLRKNDISVSETLDSNTNFVVNLSKLLSDDESTWIVFPDRKEASLALGTHNFGNCMVTYIKEAIYMINECENTKEPNLCILVNPGFNIEEWILAADLSNNETKFPIISINGNLDRLRNGYYPGIFYPGLSKVSKKFYWKAKQAFFLQPIAVDGNRFAGYLAREYPGPFEILSRKRNDPYYQVIHQMENNQDAKSLDFNQINKFVKTYYME